MLMIESRELSFPLTRRSASMKRRRGKGTCCSAPRADPFAHRCGSHPSPPFLFGRHRQLHHPLYRPLHHISAISAWTNRIHPKQPWQAPPPTSGDSPPPPTSRAPYSLAHEPPASHRPSHHQQQHADSQETPQPTILPLAPRPLPPTTMPLANAPTLANPTSRSSCGYEVMLPTNRRAPHPPSSQHPVRDASRSTSR